MAKLESEISEISGYLSTKQKDFDLVMGLVRDIVRSSAQAITMLHNKDVKGAEKTISDAQAIVKKLRKFDDVFGYHTKQAYQEYAESKIFFDIKTVKSIPSYKDVGVDQESYLMGLMDVVGELKREVVGALSDNDRKYAEYCHSKMLEIFDSTRSLRFAEAILNGFRRKQDVARMQIESSSSDLLHFGK